jgi:thiamine biosynthesis protein ThiS
VYVTVNSEARDVADGTGVADLIAALGLTPDRVAVEINGRILRRKAWPDTALRDGDRIEIVHFVGGG